MKTLTTEELLERSETYGTFTKQLSTSLVMFFDRKEYATIIHLHGLRMRVEVVLDPWQIRIYPLPEDNPIPKRS